MCHGDAATDLLLTKAIADVELTKKDFEEAKACSDAAKDALLEWDSSHLTTVEEYKNHGASVIKPGLDCYKRLFVEEGGDYKDTQTFLQAAHIFDPLWVAEAGDGADEINHRIEMLQVSGYPEFTDAAYLTALKREVPSLLQTYAKKFNWSGVEGAREYDKATEKRRADDDASNDDVSNNGRIPIHYH